jgi:RNA polymerase sigma-70 factor (family 1)
MRIALSEDMKAYKELYLLMFDKLFKFSHSLVKSKEAAEEIVSDVFIKLWNIRDQLSNVQDLKVYLYCITKNLSLNYLAKAKNSVRFDQINIESVIDFNTPEDLYVSRETINGVKQAIQELPSQCRIIFLLVRDQNMKYKQVAEILDISVFTVRNQVAIATRKISEALPSHLQFLLHFRDRFSVS